MQTKRIRDYQSAVVLVSASVLNQLAFKKKTQKYHLLETQPISSQNILALEVKVSNTHSRIIKDKLKMAKWALLLMEPIMSKGM